MEILLKDEQKIIVRSKADVYALMQQVLLRESKNRRKQERIWTVGLNSVCQIEFIELVALGKTNCASARAVEIFSYAVETKCDRIIIVHNHPSGVLEASQNDLRLTEMAVASGRILGIDVADHLIITETDYVSIIEESLKNSRVLDLFPKYLLDVALGII